jgi:hypothetical protein
MGKLLVVTAEHYNDDREEMVVNILGVAADKAGIDAILQEEYPGAVLTEKSYGFTVELPQDKPSYKGCRVEVEEFECDRADTVFVVMRSHFDIDRDYTVNRVLGVATDADGVRPRASTSCAGTTR